MAALQQTLKALERYLSEIRPVVLVRGRRNECLFVYPHCTLVIKKVNQLRSRRMNVVGHCWDTGANGELTFGVCIDFELLQLHDNNGLEFLYMSNVPSAPHTYI